MSNAWSSHIIVGEKQPIQWFLGGKVAVIQQGTSVWVGSPSPIYLLHFQELYPCQPTTVIVRSFNIHYHLSLHFCQNLPREGRGTMHNPTHNLKLVSKCINDSPLDNLTYENPLSKLWVSSVALSVQSTLTPTKHTLLCFWYSTQLV